MLHGRFFCELRQLMLKRAPCQKGMMWSSGPFSVGGLILCIRIYGDNGVMQTFDVSGLNP